MPFVRSQPPEVLEYETLTDVVREIPLEDEFLSENFNFLYPQVPIEGDHAKFRKRDTSQGTNKLTSRNAESHSRNLSGLTEYKVRMPYQKEDFFLSQSDLNNLADMENPNAKMDGEGLLAEELEDSTRKIQRTREMMIWTAFDVQYWGSNGANDPATGYTLTIDGRSVNIQDNYPMSSCSVTGNCTESEMFSNHIIDFSSAGLNEPWSTTSTDILGHLREMKKQVVQDSGSNPTHVFCSSQTLGYVLNNTAIQNLVAGGSMGNSIVQGAKNEEIGPAMSTYGPFEDLIFVVWDAQYKDSSGTEHQYIADNQIVMVPSSTDWSELQVGEVALLDNNGEPTTESAPASYSDVVRNPVGRRVYALDVSLPVIKRKQAIMTAKVA